MPLDGSARGMGFRGGSSRLGSGLASAGAGDSAREMLRDRERCEGGGVLREALAFASRIFLSRCSFIISDSDLPIQRNII